MRIEVANWTEWAWSEGLLTNNFSRIAFSTMVLDGIKKRFPHAKVNSALAIKELDGDIQEILLKLSYGGRKPEDLHPSRRLKLQTLFLAK